MERGQKRYIDNKEGVWKGVKNVILIIKRVSIMRNQNRLT